MTQHPSPIAPITNQQMLTGLAQYLADKKLLDNSTLLHLLAESKTKQITFVKAIIYAKLLDAQLLAQTVAQYFDLPYNELENLSAQNLPITTVQPEIIKQHCILPLSKNAAQLQLAVADPTDAAIFNTIKFHTGLNINLVVVPYQKLRNIIESLFMHSRYQTDDKEDAAVIKLIDQLINDAITANASDIHIEPQKKLCRIRFRIDGMLHEITTTSTTFTPRICSRLKVMANLDIAEKRLPQDGRFTFKNHRNEIYDCRLSICPLQEGEKAVVRILNPAAAELILEQLGMESEQQKLFQEQLQIPHGMCLVTGPTGSGKTITLYTALNSLNQTTKNILTVEDPIEINLSGINQVEVNHKVGLDFACALRSFLRQDPDIIMVGEIRDLETATIAIKAAQTGHLVFATLHTNSAAASITRLLNMGIPAFNLASSLNLIIAQRLLRKLCAKCKQPILISPDILAKCGLSPDAVAMQAVGCQHCRDGYSGRIPIFELLPITNAVSEMIMSNGSEIDITNYASTTGVLSLKAMALNKVRAGVTSLEEMIRIIG